jgi:acylglycerol lipase
MRSPALETLRFSDGYEASVRWWLPQRPRGGVLYFHGIESHGGWYEGSGAVLAERGWAVLMPDRRGSGRNAKARGHAESHRRLLADGVELLDALESRSGSRPTHVVGVSWGGKYAAALAAAHPDRIASLALIAPGLFPRIDLPLTEKFRVAWLLAADRTRPVPLPIHDAALFTANPERIRFAEADPLRLREATAPFLLASRRLDRIARGLGTSGWSGPLHALLAGRDRIIDNERTRAFIRALDIPHRRISEFADASHTLEFEPDPKPFWNALADGIDEAAAHLHGPPAIIAKV